MHGTDEHFSLFFLVLRNKHREWTTAERRDYPNLNGSCFRSSVGPHVPTDGAISGPTRLTWPLVNQPYPASQRQGWAPHKRCDVCFPFYLEWQYGRSFLPFPYVTVWNNHYWQKIVHVMWNDNYTLHRIAREGTRYVRLWD